MKRIVFSLAMTGLISSAAFAQFDEVKNLLAIQQYKKAQEQLDQLLTKPKNAAKPEAFILKATIVSYLMGDPANEAQAANLRQASIEAYKKYLELEPAKTLVADPLYASAPIAYYSSFFNEGIKGYNKKDWPNASNSFKQTVEWSDYIIANKLAKMEFDTSANLLAGAAFQNNKQDEKALEYFKRITDRKIGGKKLGMEAIKVGMTKKNVVEILGEPGKTTEIKSVNGDSQQLFYGDCYVSLIDGKVNTIIYDQTSSCTGSDDYLFIYQFMMKYFFDLNQIDEFETYRKLGAEKYKGFEYFEFTELDFIMSLDDEIEKTKRIEAKIAKEPNNLELLQNYGFILFDKLNAEDAKPVGNYAELEQKMINYLSQAGDKKPDDGKPFYYLGNHFVNKGVKINQDISKVTDEIKKANAAAKPDKTGKLPPPPKELTDKRDALKKAYNDEIEKGLPFLLKSADAYGKHADLKGMELQNYKRLVDQLILIYGDKKSASKVPADKAKFEAEEKKWNAIYTKIAH